MCATNAQATALAIVASKSFAKDEELHALAPSRIESGFRYSLSYSVSDLKMLEDHGSLTDCEYSGRNGEASNPSPEGLCGPRSAETSPGRFWI
jgi:hypothetical protein